MTTSTDAVPLKRFLYNASIESVAGWQTFYVDAETRKEADERARSHDTDGIYAEELSVEDIGRLSFDNETTTDDFGEFAPASKVQADHIADERAEAVSAISDIKAILMNHRIDHLAIRLNDAMKRIDAFENRSVSSTGNQEVGS